MLIITIFVLFSLGEIMQTMNLNDKQGVEICENVGRTLVDEIDTEDVWMKVEDMLKDYIKNNNLNTNASDLVDNLEWSVQVRLKKQ
jgi:uncharacterized membrane protein